MSDDLILERWETFLREAKIPIRLGVLKPNGQPSVISLWFVYEEGSLWCATRNSSKLAAYLRKNPNVGFEISSDEIPYCGIRGGAKGEIHETKGVEVLQILMNRYLGESNLKLQKKLRASSSDEIAIELVPKYASSWNFSSRMQNPIRSPDYSKPCP